MNAYDNALNSEIKATNDDEIFLCVAENVVNHLFILSMS